MLNFCDAALKLKDWSRDNYFKKQKEVLDPTLNVAKKYMSREMEDQRTGVRFPDFVDTVERVKYNELSEQDFLLRFEYASRPAIIQGVANDWPGLRGWRINRLVERFG
jgi:hypothetical protein